MTNRFSIFIIQMISAQISAALFYLCHYLWLDKVSCGYYPFLMVGLGWGIIGSITKLIIGEKNA